MLKVLDLFSGIGGFSLGLEVAGMETVAFCELDEFCQSVLKKQWPDIPIFPDIKTLTLQSYTNTIRERHSCDEKDQSVPAVDVICGGFPCQPFSVAGKKKGKEDNRYLWPEMLRIIAEFRPRWVIAENVAGLIRLGLDEVLLGLEGEDYTTQVFNIPACAVGAPHERKRLWIVAHSRRTLRQRHTDSRENSRSAQSGDAVSPQRSDKGQSVMADSFGGEHRGSLSKSFGEAESLPKIDWQNDYTTWKSGRASNLWQSSQDNVSNTNKSRLQEKRPKLKTTRASRKGIGDFSNSAGKGLEGENEQEPKLSNNTGLSSGSTQSTIRGVVDGLSEGLEGSLSYLWQTEWDGVPRTTGAMINRGKRLKALGNAVLPQIPYVLGKYILKIDEVEF